MLIQQQYLDNSLSSQTALQSYSFSIQMEFSELSRLAEPDPSHRETSSNLKAADRCVISYNFQQTHSHNVTHNLLLGMFSQPPKKIQKNVTTLSIDPPSYKAQPHSQSRKALKQDQVISRVYQNQIDARRYVNPLSSTHQVAEISNNPLQKTPETDIKKNQGLRQESGYDEERVRIPFDENEERRRSPYNSSKHKKVQLNVVRNSIEGQEVEKDRKVEMKRKLRGQASSNNQSQYYQSQSLSNRKQGNNISLHSNSHSKQKRNLHYLGSKDKTQPIANPIASYSKQHNPKHLQKVTQSEMEFQRNTQQITTRKQGIFQNNSEFLQQASDIPPLGSKYSQEQGELEAKLSRKQIQDQQLRQIEQIVRRDGSTDFKKGYFKILANNSKEFLPFNTDLQPVMHISKKNGQGITDVSGKSTVYKQNKGKQILKIERGKGVVKGKQAERNIKPSFYRGNLQKHENIDHFSSEQKIASFQKQLFPNNQNHSFNVSAQKYQEKSRITRQRTVQKEEVKNQQRLNSQPNKVKNEATTRRVPIRDSKQDHNREGLQNKGLPRQNQNMSVDIKKVKPIQQERLLGNQLRKGGREVSKNEVIRRNGSSFNVKKQDNFLGKNKKEIKNNQLKEDISANNQIKGFKVPSFATDHATTHPTPPLHSNTHNSPTRFGPQQKLGSQHRQNLNLIQQQQELSPIQQNLMSHNETPDHRETHQKNQVNELPEPVIEIKGQYFNRLEKDESENNGRRVRSRHGSMIENRSEKSVDQNRISHSLSSSGTKLEERSRRNSRSNSKVIEPHSPRTAKQKQRKFKQWRKSDIQQAKKDLYKPRINPKRNSLNPNSFERSKNSRLSQQTHSPREATDIDLDAQEEDPFGLLATHKRKSGRKVTTTKPSNFKKEVEKESSIQEEPQQSTVKESGKDSRIIQSRGSDKIISLVSQSQEQIAKGKEQFETEKEEKQIDEVREPKKEGVREIEHLIQENGSQISSITDQNSVKEEALQNKRERKASANQQTLEDRHQGVSNPDLAIPASNLEELLRATEEVNSNQKELEPILNNVEVELEQSRGKVGKRQLDEEEWSENEKGSNKDVGAIPHANIKSTRSEKGCLGLEHNQHSPRVAIEVESDYNEEEMDKIAEMPGKNKDQNKSSDFFQFNLNQTSKMSDPNQTINYTRYEQIDKDVKNYSRAPILSFIYDFTPPDIFQPSSTPQIALKQLRNSPDINDQIVDQAVQILLSVDPWVIQRIFEPFQNKEGDIGVWLYCHGQWKLFTEPRKKNFKIILREVLFRATESIEQSYQLETVLRMLSGVRVMKLKSCKKRVFKQLEYSAKKGHVIKAYTSRDSKWKGKVFEVGKVECTRQGENVLQIKRDDETFWIREQKFTDIFEHFLLICARKSHFWTERSLEQKNSQKTVLNITSPLPSHGSITLFYSSDQPSSLLLYKELDSKVLKYMGKIDEKPNHNGNLYFEFRLHGNYCLFLQTPQKCLLAVESTSPIEIGSPEFVVRDTLRNEDCEYLELSQSKSKKEIVRNSASLQKLRQTFIRMVANKK